MTLRRRTALAVLIACTIAVIVLYFTLQGILAARFTTLERQKANQDLGRASNALSQDIAGIETVVRDWAPWDDTYRFVQDRNAEYIASNLEASTLVNLGISFVLFVNPAGQIVYSKAVDLSSETETALPAGLEQYATGETLLARHTSETSSVAGILVLPEQPAIVASQPILTSQKEGPIAGSVIMGRYLSSEEAQMLSQVTDLSLELHRVDESDLPADFEAARSSMSGGRTTLVRVLDSKTVAAYMLLTDIYGSPALVLRVDEPREIYAQGQQTAQYILYLLLGLGLLFSVVFILEIDRLVLSRLRRLSTSVEAVGRSRNLSERVSVGGKDELTAVAEAINATLASLEQSHRDLVETEAKNRALVDAIPDLMFRINREGKIIETRRPQKVRTPTDNRESPPSQGIPDELMDLLPTQIQQMAMPHVTEALQSRQTQVFEFQLSVDSRVSHYEARVLASSDDEALIMVRDVTEQKHEEEARQKSLLLKEIHHRVKNNLQVISGLLYLQARRTKDTKLMEVLNESSNRVKSVALIHQRLQQSKDTVSVELSEYIRDLTTVLLHSCGRDAAVITLNLDLETSVVIGIDTAVPCGLIVNELISNSLKHAFPEGHGGEINISLHSDDTDTITLVVGDNGVGLPEGLDFRKADSLGLQLVMSLVSQLGGSIDIDTRSGTQSTIHFRENGVPSAEESSREPVCAGAGAG
jgi:two-component sensor histidine kinase/sensor domain CHASE-containing protein